MDPSDVVAGVVEHLQGPGPPQGAALEICQCRDVQRVVRATQVVGAAAGVIMQRDGCQPQIGRRNEGQGQVRDAGVDDVDPHRDAGELSGLADVEGRSSRVEISYGFAERPLDAQAVDGAWGSNLHGRRGVEATVAVRGRELLDLPDAPRPDPDTPAPVRFLPAFDNAILGYDDRSRIVDDAHRGLSVAGERAVLVDGRVAAIWTVDAGTVVVTPLRRFSRAERAEVAEEGRDLAAFLSDGEHHRVRVGGVVRLSVPRSWSVPYEIVVHSLPMSPSSGARRLRSAAFAASAVGLTLGAHVTAHGEPPDVLLLLLLVALVDATSSTFTRRPRGPVATAAALLVTQAVLHLAFVLATPAHSAHAEHVPSLPMLVAHGIVAVVLAVVLSHGERLISHVARVLLPVAVLRPFRPLPVSRLVVAVVPDDVPRGLGACPRDISRRGPPNRAPAAHT